MFAEGALVNRKYRVLADLGQGGLGLSYKVLLLGTTRACVIKVLDSALVPSLIPVHVVEQTVLKSSGLRHPAIIAWQSVESGSEGETILVRDFVEGPSLKGALAEGKPLSVARASHIVRQIALGLEAGHQMKMVHGDLRPENILLGDSERDDKIHILDFGMARLRENFTYSLHKLTLKNPGPILGSPLYLSPEQAAGLHGDSLDSRCDIYSLGIIFYQLLTGQLPLPAGPPLQSLIWHAMGTPPDLREGFPDLEIPEELSQLVRQMLAKPREKRLEGAQALIQRLETFDGRDQQVPVKSIAAPSFSLLSDRGRPKTVAKSSEVRAPRVKPTTEAKEAVEAAKIPPTQETPAEVLPVGAVEISSAQPAIHDPMKSSQPRLRSSRGWGIAASILIVLGLGAAGYHFRNGLPWAGRASGHQLQVWGQKLGAVLHTSTQKMQAGTQAWSQKVEAQISSPHPTSASAAAHPQTQANPSSVVAQNSNAPGGTPPQSPTSGAPAASAAGTGANRPAQAGGAGNVPADSSKNPALSPPSKGNQSLHGSRRAAVSNAAAAKPSPPPRQEEANSIVKKASAAVPLDSATITRTIAGDLRNGDSLFDVGKYDEAISDYKAALALAPANRVLLDRIARAKRAQAAEAEYLGQ